MVYDSNNIFARILRCEVSCKKILEGEYFLSFYDLNPHKKVHALVIPKGPYLDYGDFCINASISEVTGFFQGVLKVIEHLNLEKEGYRLICNTGLNGGQEVPHFHLHILGGEPVGPIVEKNLI